MVVLIYRDHHEILLKDVDLPGPALDSLVPPSDWVFSGLYGGGLSRQPGVPEGGEDVDPEQKC